MTTVDRSRTFSERLSEEFARIAFAEVGELYPAHPHKVRTFTEVFTEVAFAEEAEEYHSELVYTKPPRLCVNGQTPGGLCV